MRQTPMVGFKVGRLTVIKYACSNGKLAQWLCLCECGNQIVVIGHCLRRSKPTKSCGCLSPELSSKRLIGNLRKLKHGEAATGRITHEWRTWYNMRCRCYQPSTRQWKDYGGRGIQVCARWFTFQNFLTDMGRKPSRKHSIDRINVNGHYMPSNCRWATSLEQASNKR